MPAIVSLGQFCDTLLRLLAQAEEATLKYLSGAEVLAVQTVQYCSLTWQGDLTSIS